MLTREDLSSERIDQIVADARAAGYDFFLSSPEREASLNEALLDHPPGEEAWVFAYGSLMWNPAFEYRRGPARQDRRLAPLLLLLDADGPGTPELPGLMLALENGGECEGIAYRLSPELVRANWASCGTAKCWRASIGLDGCRRSCTTGGPSRP